MKRLFPLLVLFALLVGAWFGWAFASEAWLGKTPSPTPITFVLSSGMDASEAAKALQTDGVIPSAFRYRLYGYFDRSVRFPKAGEYQLRAGQSYREIARQLALGPARREVQVRIIEGWTVEDITTELQTQFGVDPKETSRLIGRAANRASFDESLRADFPFLKNLPGHRSLEGYLFPDTYRVWGDQLPEGLVRKQLEEFAQRYATSTIGPQSAPLKTLDEVVILASIVESEVQTTRDRRIVAGIFLNRLRDGMALQTDASIAYITGSGRSRSTAKDLSIDSPFNTYKYPGLPPAPIANPGADSLEAVLHPAPTDYRYFLTDPKGTVYYARTLEEHAQNRRKAGY